MKKTDELKNFNNLEFGIIEKQLNFLRSQPNEDRLDELKNAIGVAWKRQRQHYTDKKLR